MTRPGQVFDEVLKVLVVGCCGAIAWNVILEVVFEKEFVAKKHVTVPVLARVSTSRSFDLEARSREVRNPVWPLPNGHFAVPSMDEAPDDGACLKAPSQIGPPRGGHKVGFQIYSLRPESYVGELGFEAGDIIESVNGIILDDPAHVLKVYELLRDLPLIEVVFERKGSTLRRVFEVSPKSVKAPLRLDFGGGHLFVPVARSGSVD